VFRVGPGTNSLPFNAVASFATSGIVVGVIVLLVVVKLVRSVGWRRVLRRRGSPAADTGTGPDETDARRPRLETQSIQLTCLTVADPDAEPDPRRAIIGCYLQMLEVAARHGPERRHTETPTEYLRRMLVATVAAAAPATSLTGLFERARYSEQPVDESMRSDAIAALGALRDDLLVGAVG
jgi:hypothetical protein